MRLRRLTILLLGALILPMLLLAAASLAAQTHEAATVNELDRLQALRLADQEMVTGLADEQSGIRGYSNTGQAEFLDSYLLGQREYADADAKLRAGVSGGEVASLRGVEAASEHYQAWATARINAVTVAGGPLFDLTASQDGKQRFDAFRSAESGLASSLRSAGTGQTRISDRRTVGLRWAVLILLALNLVMAVAVAVTLFRRVLRPVEALAAAAVGVAAGRSEPLPHLDRRDEIGGLAAALERWRGAGEARIALARAMVDVSLRTDLDEVLELGAQHLLRVLEADQVVLTLVQPGGPLVAASRPEPFGPGRFVINSPGGEAMRTGEVIITSLEDDRWDPAVRDWAGRLGLGPAVGMPMLAGGELVGAATLLRGRARAPFSEADLSWASLVLPPLAAAARSAGLHADLERTNQALIRADTHKSQFLANMSHELRTPLNSILGFTDILIGRHAPVWGDVKAERFLGIIKASGQHLLTLINDILDLSKIDAGRMRLEPERFAVGELARETLQSFEPLIRGKELQVRAEIDRDLEMVGDPRLIRQLLLNLISNAIKFTPAKGGLGVSVRKTGEKLDIRIADSGIGIAPEDQERIFSAFEQVAAAAAGQAQGTGLGLALAKRIVELHGGSIGLESAPGEGTTFIVQLPADVLEQADPRGGEPVTDEVRSGRPLVLVVEDEAEAIALLKEHIGQAGYDVVVARDGEEALEKARRLRPAAITLDVVLPKIHGWDLLGMLKLDPVTKDIPVLVVSIVDNPSLARALGAVDYLVKPIDPALLISILGGLIDGHPARPARILAIDDSVEELELMAGHLGDAGFEVVTSADGQRGLELARLNVPDAILLDLVMPGLTGFEVLRSLKADPATRMVPIVVVTGKVLSQEEEALLTGQTAAVLSKNPGVSLEVVSKLGQLVRHRTDSVPTA